MLMKPIRTATGLGHPLGVLVVAGIICGIVTIIARDGGQFTFSVLVRRRLHGLRLALTTWPDGKRWRWCAAIAAIYVLIAAPLGLGTGFLQPVLIQGSWRKFVLVPAALFIQPGLLEELIFRVLMLPHPTERVSLSRTVIGSAAGLVAFILYHPVNGMTLAPAARPLFTDMAFLVQAALIGLACTLAYLISGSVWPPIFIHWLPVTGWIMFFDGAARVARAGQFNSL